MASYKGVAPKSDEDRVRRNKPIYDKVPLRWDGITRGPTLPKAYPWCTMTKRWWNKFRKSPQAMVCHESDWLFLIDTALVYDKIWTNAERLSAAELKGLANELRIRMSTYGDTWDNRLKQRIVLESPDTDAAKEAEVQQDAAQVVNYAAMLAEEFSKNKT